MKRLMLTMAIMAMGTLSAFAQNTLTKEYDFGKITKIEASSIFDIEVTQGNTKKVIVVYDEVFKDRLEITGILGKLELNLSQAPFKRDNSKKNAGIKVYLQMPTIEEIDLSGASKLKADGVFTTDELDIELSGATSVKGLQAKGTELSIDCSGASSLQMSANFKYVDTELSGASKLTYTGDSQAFEGDFSGAINATFYGDHTKTEIECSGATKVTMEGETDYLKAVLSGACKFSGEKYEAKDAYVEATGASNAEVRCTGDLRLMVSKVSKLTHYGNPNIIIVDKDSNIRKGD